MAISSLLSSITNAIAALSITGVTIRDRDEIPAAFNGQANVLYPSPSQPEFVTNFRPVYRSFTRGASAQVDLSYTLNYRFLGTPVGSMGNFTKAYADLVDKVLLILAEMIETTAPYDGRVDMEVAAVTFGPRSDPSGAMFHGADIALSVTEMQNT